MAKKAEMRVREYLERRLKLKFEAARLSIGTRENVDGWMKLKPPWILVLEVEDQQSHPTTNVLKLWPFLETKRNAAVVLVHAYFPGSRAISSSRGQLATWLGHRLERMFRKRFRYRRLELDFAANSCSGLEALVDMLEAIGPSRTSRSTRSRAKTRAPG